MKRNLRALYALSVVSALSAPASAALLVQYTFDEASAGATTALNTGTLGSGADGTFSGTAARSTDTPGGVGASFSSNGGTASNYLTAGDVSGLQTGMGQFTLVTWVNLQANPTAGDGVIAKGTSSGGFSWQFANPTSGTLSAQNFRFDLALKYGSGQYSADITSGGIGEWMLVAVSYKWNPYPANRSDINYYVGGLDSAVASAGSLAPVNAGLNVTTNSGTELRIGGTARGTGDRSPSALFDDVRIYNEVLTQAQLEEIRMATIPEPLSEAFLGLAGMGLMLCRRRHRRVK